jgi:chemotaxis protein CheD
MDQDNHFSENSLITHYLLEPGYILVPDNSVSISAVIGSGISICIFDRKKKIGGMNHFIFPYIATKGKTTALYGNIATITLLKMMLARESSIKSLEA